MGVGVGVGVVMDNKGVTNELCWIIYKLTSFFDVK